MVFREVERPYLWRAHSMLAWQYCVEHVVVDSDGKIVSEERYVVVTESSFGESPQTPFVENGLV